MKIREGGLKGSAIIRKTFISAGVMTLFFTISCKKLQVNSLRPEAAELYRKSADLIKLYTCL
ncbi:MAG: hypothetical protein K2G23_08445, partial [Muribaculaceae bacterium]|nr:hypothetical protein [Muribaculaceae bacterium]